MIGAASLPCGLDETGLPVGAQLVGIYLSNKLVLQTLHFLENRSGFQGWLDRNCFVVEKKRRSVIQKEGTDVSKNVI